MSTRRPRVAIVHDGFVPTYRVPLYRALARSDGIDYVVFHSDPPADIAHLAAHPPFDFEHRYVLQRTMRMAGRTLIHQHLVREIVRDYDAVILGAWMRFVSTHALRAAFELRNRPVIYWGFGGWMPHEAAGLPRPVLNAREAIKLKLARSVDAYLAYTAGAADSLVARGVDPNRVFVLGNTLDMDRLADLRAEAHRHPDGRVRAALGVPRDTPVIVYLGRFIGDKRVTDLPEIARRVNHGRLTPARFVLIGDGPERAHVAELTNADPNVHLTGPLDDLAVAYWLSAATAVVVPGRVGLVANHAFANGVPVIARVTELNGPEVEYLRHDTNGLLVDGDLNEFARAIGGLIDDPEHRRALSAGALATTADLGLDRMVRSFEDGVRYAFGLSRRPAPSRTAA